jgi:hypothetical protein
MTENTSKSKRFSADPAAPVEASTPVTWVDDDDFDDDDDYEIGTDNKLKHHKKNHDNSQAARRSA